MNTVNPSLTSECVFLQHPPALLDLMWNDATKEIQKTQGSFLDFSSASSYFESVVEAGLDEALQRGFAQFTYELEESGQGVPSSLYDWFDNLLESAQAAVQLRQYATEITEELSGPDVDLMSFYMDETCVTADALKRFIRDECFILDDFLELLTDNSVKKRFAALFTLQQLMGAGCVSMDNWDIFLDELEHINYASFWDLGIKAQALTEADLTEHTSPEVLCRLMEIDSSFNKAVIKAWFYQGDHEYAYDVLNSLLAFYFPTTSNH